MFALDRTSQALGKDDLEGECRLLGTKWASGPFSLANLVEFLTERRDSLLDNGGGQCSGRKMQI